jgi:hypothetical protein
MHVYRPSVIIAVVDTVNAQPKINVLVTMGTTAPGATGVGVRTAERGEYLTEDCPHHFNILESRVEGLVKMKSIHVNWQGGHTKCARCRSCTSRMLEHGQLRLQNW